MKKLLPILLSVLMLLSTSCADGGRFAYVRFANAEEIAVMTSNEIVNAINQKNATEIVEMFSKKVQTLWSLPPDSLRLLDFIDGEIISFSPQFESVTGVRTEVQEGKKRKEIQSSFFIETTKSKYYIAIKECISDDFDSNNEGVISLYIIEASNWIEDYVYRGDGEWTLGINIVE